MATMYSTTRPLMPVSLWIEMLGVVDWSVGDWAGSGGREGVGQAMQGIAY